MPSPSSLCICTPSDRRASTNVLVMQAVDKAGYTIILTGHSLGGGTAALLGLSLRNRGISRVQGYGFATPPCMTQDLAAQCKDWFTDVAFRDDVVSRFGPQSLAALHAELREYEWEDAAKV